MQVQTSVWFAFHQINVSFCRRFRRRNGYSRSPIKGWFGGGRIAFGNFKLLWGRELTSNRQMGQGGSGAGPNLFYSVFVFDYRMR
jgi:hypothetical protein